MINRTHASLYVKYKTMSKEITSHGGSGVKITRINYLLVFSDTLDIISLELCRSSKMATFQVAPPENFNFKKPEFLAKWN